MTFGLAVVSAWFITLCSLQYGRKGDNKRNSNFCICHYNITIHLNQYKTYEESDLKLPVHDDLESA